ncbi:MAG: calcium-binding protein, partial [Selenomonadaceae bacterium]|nr:calcium-binding protein [Selenomonadaceae bacterium]
MSAFNNSASASVVSGTSSADSITNAGSFSTIDAGEGKDTIINSSVIGFGILEEDDGLFRYENVTLQGAYSSISGGPGNDLIIDLVGRSTINAGAGNDTVTLGAYSIFEYANGDGNDLILNYTADNAIKITEGSLKSTVNSGKNVVLTVGDGKITIKGAKGTALNIVDAESEVPSIPDETFERRILGTDDDDTLYTQNPGVTVRGGKGDDLIVNTSNVGNNSMLVGGEGNDTLVSNSKGVLIDGGDGDDLIELGGFEQTVWFRGIDGNDTIVGYGSTDTVHVVDGVSYSTQQSGDDIIIKVGEASLTLKDAADQILNIDDTTVDDEVREPEWLIAEPGMPDIDYNKKKGSITVGKDFNGEVDAANFDFNAVSKIDASAVTAKVALKAGKSAAVLTAGKGDATLVGGGGNDKLYGGPSSDTFVYTVGEGQDVIGNTAKDQSKTLYQEQDTIIIVDDNLYDVSDLIIKDSKLATIITFPGDKKSKLTINKASVDTPLRFYFGSSSETAIETGEVLYGVLPDGVHYASKTAYNRLNVDDTLDGEIIDIAYLNSQIVTVDASNSEGYVEIRGNANNNVLKASKSGAWLAGGAGNDQLYGSTEEDAFDVFEFQMQSSGKKDIIYNYKSNDQIIIDMSLLEDALPEFDAESGVITYDGAKANFNGFNDSKDDVVITLNKKNTLTIKNAAGKPINLVDIDGSELGTFGHVLPDGLAYNQKRTDIFVSDTELVESMGEPLEINLSNEDEYANKYFSAAVNVDLSGVELETTIVGNNKTNVLKAGNFYSVLNGGGGNDQLYGSTVEDSQTDFIYSSGKDTVYNYNPDIDYIYIDSDTPIDYDVLATVTARNFVEKGNDVILNISNKYSLTIQDGVGKVIEIIDDTGALDDGMGFVRYDFSVPDGLKYDSTKRTALLVEDNEQLIALGGIDIDLSNESEGEYAFATSVKKIDLSSIDDEN